MFVETLSDLKKKEKFDFILMNKLDTLLFILTLSYKTFFKCRL